MSSLAKMKGLTEDISKQTTILTDYLSSRGLGAASFDVHGLAEFPIDADDEIPFKARQQLAAATKELHDISVGPKQSLHDLAWDGFTSTLSLRAMWEFKVADAVPLHGSISYQELTAEVEKLNNNIAIGVDNLRRLIRHAMTNRIYCEPIKNQVAHTRASRLLLEDEPNDNWVGFCCKDVWLPAAHVVDAMKKWPNSEESNETGVNLAYNHSTEFFDWLPQDHERNHRYNLAMKSHGNAAGYSVDHLINGYAWADLGPGKQTSANISQMGGNQGHISIALAEAFPQLNFVVQDLAALRLPEIIGTVPAHLADRVKLIMHDFFTSQTEVGAACYFMRHIMHAFSDKYCVKILQALVPALRKGRRVLVNDGALAEPETASYLEEKAMRTLDLIVKITVNAREREADDWIALFARADSRYKVNRIWRPKGSVLALVEAEWMGE
ncbi:O-methyltransferase-domain-containing protein [Podospora australis]|uniref:O-methyltransferase-domain-containing protein n=1 Tax=Podospora australis TaxID=1536484 RepID=A0AAN6WP18_9PEZI|nr:O-methyltransferase-domain-containing protein [Podospora australis]